MNITIAKAANDSNSNDLPGIKADHVKDLVRYLVRFIDAKVIAYQLIMVTRS